MIDVQLQFLFTVKVCCDHVSCEASVFFFHFLFVGSLNPTTSSNLVDLTERLLNNVKLQGETFYRNLKNFAAGALAVNESLRRRKLSKGRNFDQMYRCDALG